MQINNFTKFQILSEILSNFTVKELKELRFVSKLWNEEAFKHLKKRSNLVLNFNYGHESLQFSRYFIEIENNTMENWLVRTPSTAMEDQNLQSLSQGQPEPKFLDIVNNPRFKDVVTKSLKTLELTGEINSQSDYDVHLQFFKALALGLEEFIWGGDWDLDTASGEDFPFPADIIFHKLRIFTFSLFPSGDESLVDDCSSFTWLKLLLRAISGVTTIRLEGAASLSLTFLNFLTRPESMVWHRNLTELVLQLVTVDVLKILLKLDNPLKKLAIY